MILYFFLTAVCIVATIVCIAIETEWWVWVISAGLALLCAAIAIAKLREELEYVRAARKPKAEKPKKPKAAKPKKPVKYPTLIEHCLSLSESELLAFAKKHYGILLQFWKSRFPEKNNHKGVFLGLLLVIFSKSNTISKAEADFFRHFDPDADLASADLSDMKKESEAALRMAQELPYASLKNSYLSLCAAATVAGGITPEKLTFFKKLLENSKKEPTQ